MKLRLSALGMCLLLAACQSVGSAKPESAPAEQPFAQAPIQIVFEDIDPSFWVQQHDASLYFNIFVYYSGERIRSKDVKEMRIRDQNGLVWRVGSPEATDTYIGGWVRFWTEEYSSNESVLSLGRYRVEIEMTNGQVYRMQYDPTDPDPKRGNVMDFVYSSDYKGRKGDLYVQAIQRPEVQPFGIESGKVHYTFSVADSRVQNGRAVFFDQDMNYVAETDQFVNPYSLEGARFINKGTSLYVDGSPNQLEIGLRDLHFAVGKSLSDIKYGNVVLTDRVDWLQVPKENVTEFQARSARVGLK